MLFCYVVLIIRKKKFMVCNNELNIFNILKYVGFFVYVDCIGFRIRFVVGLLLLCDFLLGLVFCMFYLI